MKQVVGIIVGLFVTAAILIWSLTASIEASKAPQHEHAAVTHSAGSH
jgi:hypothetical protein